MFIYIYTTYYCHYYYLNFYPDTRPQNILRCVRGEGAKEKGYIWLLSLLILMIINIIAVMMKIKYTTILGSREIVLDKYIYIHTHI